MFIIFSSNSRSKHGTTTAERKNKKSFYSDESSSEDEEDGEEKLESSDSEKDSSSETDSDSEIQIPLRVRMKMKMKLLSIYRNKTLFVCHRLCLQLAITTISLERTIQVQNQARKRTPRLTLTARNQILILT